MSHFPYVDTETDFEKALNIFRFKHFLAKNRFIMAGKALGLTLLTIMDVLSIDLALGAGFFVLCLSYLAYYGTTYINRNSILATRNSTTDDSQSSESSTDKEATPLQA
jgi:hypothetical protein